MRTKGDESVRLVPLIPAQDLLHRGFEIVVSKRFENAAEEGERLLVRLQKRLLRGPEIRFMERGAREHRAHREDLDLGHHSIEFRPRFIPVHLRFLARGVRLGDEDLARREAEFLLASSNVSANRGCRDSKFLLFDDPALNAFGRMSMLSW